jgi:hypothetical protein
MNYKIKVVGVTPYMQHRMDDAKLESWEKERGAIIERDHLADNKQKLAAYHSYIDSDGNYYIPSEHFKQSFVKGGGFVKGKVGNATKSMKNIVAAMWRIKEEKIFLGRMFDTVDSRSAVNKNVKARVMVHRPKWNEWEAEFTLLIDEDYNNRLTKETVEKIISYAGRYLGIGSYRPEHTGEYGRFNLVSCEALVETDEQQSKKAA